jgi:tRNA 2-selenouridine synthase
LQPERATATVDQISEFDEIIDVRTPAEFAEDRVPGAVNRPVLYDEERARVGTIYKQVSAFNGRKTGAALVSRNIARHIEEHFMERPRTWRPLVYCWRGGKRSDAMVHILRQIGWDAHRLDGGYRAYRRSVVRELPELARRFTLRVLCGLTGSGKSRLLEHLERQGAQVLDLERMAAHRGSVLGNLPGQPQPAQKMFESRIWDALRRFDPARPVFVESESKRIGVLQVPDELMSAMWASSCVRLETDTALRVALLREQYDHFLCEPATLGVQLDCLTQLHGRAAIERWKQMAQQAHWDLLVQELLQRHYDPAYTRSILSHYPNVAQAPSVELTGGGTVEFYAAASAVLAIATPSGGSSALGQAVRAS